MDTIFGRTFGWILTAIFSFAVAAGTAQAATITDLGGGIPYGINDSGQVVGSSNNTAFLYTPGIGMTNLGTFGGFSSYANGINDAGQVVGSYYLSGSGLVPNVFLYTPGSGMTQLGGPYSEANGINTSGQVVGYSLSGSGWEDAFLYTPGIGMTDLDVFGGDGSHASGINDAGQVVGYYVPSGGWGESAFLYTPGSGMTDLGRLGGFGSSLATGINASGQVVGAASNGDYTNAFLYTPGTGMTNLGTLGSNYSQATGINASGQIVGISSDAGGDMDRPFLYSNGAMIDLNSLLPPGSGWTLETATAINESGQIVGWGRNPEGHVDGFLLDTAAASAAPEPSSMALFGAAGAFLALVRKNCNVRSNHRSRVGGRDRRNKHRREVPPGRSHPRR